MRFQRAALRSGMPRDGAMTLSDLPVDRLVVVCADTLLDHIPVEVEQYDDTVLWKTLRTLCTREIGSLAVLGNTARICTVPDAAPAT